MNRFQYIAKHRFQILAVLGVVLVSTFLLSYLGKQLYLDRAKNRVGTGDIHEAKKRGVFVKSLKYEVIDSPSIIISGFSPFIEISYRYGLNSVHETRSLEGTCYPFKLAFKTNPSTDTSIFTLTYDLSTFDSSDAVWGYMENPTLKDTVYLEVYNIHQYRRRKLIKVWE
ncbi:MAG: hypothetical protein DI598_00065 [Pseudopedobacter saltans]|uniref:Uncharacterized protein n=1 Tax=Pseudopedobacter saltans TaxID=151895 RepID=A0A2W5FEG2_9SPHI|nr:MAG: hypothetical protein DI598_00065 [Pseudopedobacter saltans]